MSVDGVEKRKGPESPTESTQNQLGALSGFVEGVKKAIGGTGESSEILKGMMDNLGAITSYFKGFLETILGEDWFKKKEEGVKGAENSNSTPLPTSPPSIQSPPSPSSLARNEALENSKKSLEEIVIANHEAFVLGDSTGNGLANLRPGIKRQAFNGLRASQFLKKLENEQFEKSFKTFAQNSKVVILNFGGNEAASNLWTQESVKNQDAIIKKLLEANPDLRIVVIARPGYPDGFTPREEITANMPKNIKEINTQKLEQWKNNPNVVVVSCDSMNSNGHLKEDYVIAKNNIHLNRKGLEEVWRLIQRDGAIEFS